MLLTKAVQQGQTLWLRCECMGEAEADAVYGLGPSFRTLAAGEVFDAVRATATGGRDSLVGDQVKTAGMTPTQAIREFARLHQHTTLAPEAHLAVEGRDLLTFIR